MADSDDLIRQAKESLGSEPDRPPPTRPAPPPEPEPEPEELVRPAPEPVYEQKSMPKPDPFTAARVDPRQRGRMIGQRIGMVILGLVGVFWALMLIGLAVDPTDAGSAIIGLVVITALPIVLGVYLVRKGREE